MTQFEQNFKTLYGREFDPLYDFSGGWLYDSLINWTISFFDFIDPPELW